jgi:threonine dehydrogenase-like Zn-dependent dehydrogenase
MNASSIPALMKVPVFEGEGKISFREKPVPQPGWQFYEGTEITPGHEAAGVVVATGSEARTPIGTPGVIFLMDFCGTCRSCRLGFTQQCLSKRGDMGFNRDGGYGRYELIHENIFFPVDIGIPLAEATLLLGVQADMRLSAPNLSVLISKRSLSQEPDRSGWAFWR